jgi:hypothetical protein
MVVPDQTDEEGRQRHVVPLSSTPTERQLFRCWSVGRLVACFCVATAIAMVPQFQWWLCITGFIPASSMSLVARVSGYICCVLFPSTYLSLVSRFLVLSAWCNVLIKMPLLVLDGMNVSRFDLRIEEGSFDGFTNPPFTVATFRLGSAIDSENTDYIMYEHRAKLNPQDDNREPTLLRVHKHCPSLAEFLPVSPQHADNLLVPSIFFMIICVLALLVLESLLTLIVTMPLWPFGCPAWCYMTAMALLLWLPRIILLHDWLFRRTPGWWSDFRFNNEAKILRNNLRNGVALMFGWEGERPERQAAGARYGATAGFVMWLLIVVMAILRAFC